MTRRMQALARVYTGDLTLAEYDATLRMFDWLEATWTAM